MQASETKVRQLIEGTRQYVVPLFQRPYSWKETQWKALWNDVLDQTLVEDGRPHFFGSIVTTSARSVPQGVGKWLLIDGQQRITTVQVLLAAIRDVAVRHGDTKLTDRINGQYLTNAYEEADERLKVLPTQDDRNAFRAIIQREDIAESRLRSCYQYFISQIERLKPERLDSIHLAVVDRLSLVSIVCDEFDNPHLIFESLNAKGEKLTPADLIRNFLLMRVHIGDQEAIFRSHWLPIQQALNDHLTEFVRHYLMKEGRILKEADIYFELKDRLANSTPEKAKEFLQDLHRHGMFYAKFVDATQGSDVEITERLDRLRRLKVTVAYPFLLRVFDAYDRGDLSREQVFEALDILESFVMRRYICGKATNQLRRMLPPVFDAAGGASPTFIEGLREQLGGARCPDDQSFASAVASVSLYSSTEKNARLRLILERIEQSFGHKEPADLTQATIEHILPQTLTPAWEQELGDGAEEHWSQLVHTLGNLTLTAYNAELSNHSYLDKRRELTRSHYELNRDLAVVERWSPEAIKARGDALAQRALKIWCDVGRLPSSGASEKRSSTPPVKVRFKDEIQPVANWRDGYIKLLSSFDDHCPGLLAQIASEQTMRGSIDANGNQFRRSKTQIKSIHVNTHASAAQLQLWCRRIAELGKINPADYEFILQSSPLND